MKKTKIFLLAGVVLPAFAIAAPSIAAPLVSNGSIVVAQSDDSDKSDKQQRREERQQQKEERQQQKQERQQSREDRQQPGADKPSREERQQQKEERQQQRQERQQPATSQGGGDAPKDAPKADSSKSREDRPSREERQQQRQERQQNRDSGSDASPSQTREPKADRATNPGSSDQDRSERRRNRDEDRPGAQNPSNSGSDRPNASDKSSDDSKSRLQQMREDRERERAGGGVDRSNPSGGDRPTRDADKPNRDQWGDKDRQNRPDDAKGGDDRTNRDKLQDLRDQRREDRRDERREDKREEKRVDDLKERIKDEKRENERKDDRIDRLKDERKETRDGNRVIITEPGGRRIIRDGDKVIIRRDETARFRFGVNPRDIREERRGGEIRTVVTRPDGSRVITITDEDGRLIRRVREDRGQEYVLIDNRPRGGAGGLFINLDIAPPRISIPRERYIVDADVASERDIVEAFEAPPVERLERSYSLDEIRQSAPLRQYVRSVDLDSVTFDTGSWYVRDDQITKLDKVGEAMEAAVKKNPRTVFMVEGHTDAVGSDEDNLSLSDRRAEAVAEVLTKYFDIPAENLTTQGYGEQYLKVQTDGAEERNRRVTVRNITRLLTSEK